MRQNAMCGMTRSACRRDNESPLEQTLAVNTLRIVFKNSILMNHTLALDWSSFLVTFPADKWDAKRNDGRTRVLHTENYMSAMAVLTPWGKRITSGNCLAMKTFLIQGLFSRMAIAAGNFRERLGVREFLALKISVAGNALERSMNRGRDLLLVHIKRSGSPPNLFQSLIVVTHQAVAVLLSNACRHSCEHQAEYPKG